MSSELRAARRVSTAPLLPLHFATRAGAPIRDSVKRVAKIWSAVPAGRLRRRLGHQFFAARGADGGGQSVFQPAPRLAAASLDSPLWMRVPVSRMWTASVRERVSRLARSGAALARGNRGHVLASFIVRCGVDVRLLMRSDRSFPVNVTVAILRIDYVINELLFPATGFVWQGKSI